jgi:hypothetical protein
VFMTLFGIASLLLASGWPVSFDWDRSGPRRRLFNRWLSTVVVSVLVGLLVWSLGGAGDAGIAMIGAQGSLAAVFWGHEARALRSRLFLSATLVSCGAALLWVGVLGKDHGLVSRGVENALVITAILLGFIAIYFLGSSRRSNSE